MNVLLDAMFLKYIRTAGVVCGSVKTLKRILSLRVLFAIELSAVYSRRVN